MDAPIFSPVKWRAGKKREKKREKRVSEEEGAGEEE